MINKYRKRPVEVEAIQFDGWNWREVYQFICFRQKTPASKRSVGGRCLY